MAAASCRGTADLAPSERIRFVRAQSQFCLSTESAHLNAAVAHPGGLARSQRAVPGCRLDAASRGSPGRRRVAWRRARVAM